MLLPTSKVRDILAPIATFFRKLPSTCPLVLDTLPAVPMITLLEPVMIFPVVKVNTPLTVILFGMVRLVLAMVRLLKVSVLPVITCAPPLNLTVLLPPAAFTVIVPLVKVPVMFNMVTTF